jgi:hypothetical protein
MRRIQDRWIAPGQTTQIPTIHAEILRSLSNVAEIPTQGARRSLVGQMRQRCRPLRKRRHPRSIRFRRLRSGPGPLRPLEIRLLARIDNGFSVPRRSPLSHAELTFAQSRLKPRTALHRAPQSRTLEPQRLLAFQHGFELRNATLRALPDAQCISARPNSAPRAATRTNDIVEMQPQCPHPSTTCRASKPRPRAAARKPPQMDADVLLNVAELDAEHRRRRRNNASRPQATYRQNW